MRVFPSLIPADPIATIRIVILLHSLMTTSELPFECFCVCVFDDRTETTIGASALHYPLIRFIFRFSNADSGGKF